VGEEGERVCVQTYRSEVRQFPDCTERQGEDSKVKKVGVCEFEREIKSVRV
jgi:hypothetical protein